MSDSDTNHTNTTTSVGKATNKGFARQYSEHNQASRSLLVEDALVNVVLQTLDNPEEAFSVDATGRTTSGPWPLQNNVDTEAWKQRAASAIEQYNNLCETSKPRKGGASQVFATVLDTVVQRSVTALKGVEVGGVRSALAGIATSRGLPGTPQREEYQKRVDAAFSSNVGGAVDEESLLLGATDPLKSTAHVASGTSSIDEALAKHAETPLCCLHIHPKLSCKLPCGAEKGQCAHLHAADDGTTRCHFGATCQNGHAKRVLPANLEQRKKFWELIGSVKSPASRDATELRSQLEAWNTPHLKRRLENDFGYDPALVATMKNSEVLDTIIDKHRKGGEFARRTIRVNGTPVRPELLADILVEMEAWSELHQHNDRPSIRASSYTILRSPADFSDLGAKAATIAERKIKQHAKVWELALQAITEVDPVYAQKFTALALTKNFIGSPHIDRQNTGPFYGMSLGTFPEGQGGVCVENGAFEVAHVNTRNRLGKVDGRFPHWVAPYDESCDRYSLIYYQTDGAHQPRTTAYFGTPLWKE